MLRAWAAKNDTIFIRAGLVPRSLETGAPMSIASIWISSSNRSSRTAARRVSNAERSYGVHLLHGPSNACRAARTAWSTSDWSPAARRANTSPVDGLTVVSVRPDEAGTALAVDQQVLDVAGQEGLGRLARSGFVEGGHLMPFACESDAWSPRMNTPLPIRR